MLSFTKNSGKPTRQFGIFIGIWGGVIAYREGANGMSKPVNHSAFILRCKMPMPKGFKHSEETKNKISETIAKKRKGNLNPNYKGGEKLSKDGYIYILKPEHPHAGNRGYIFKHRLIMEKKLGRYLTEQEIVHHNNGDKTDNRPENLVLFPNNSEHTTFHHRTKKG